MSTVESTAILPEGWAYASLYSGLQLESDQIASVSYDSDEDTVGIRFGKLYFCVTRAQWDALKAAADSVILAQVPA